MVTGDERVWPTREVAMITLAKRWLEGSSGKSKEFKMAWVNLTVLEPVKVKLTGRDRETGPVGRAEWGESANETTWLLSKEKMAPSDGDTSWIAKMNEEWLIANEFESSGNGIRAIMSSTICNNLRERESFRLIKTKNYLDDVLLVVCEDWSVSGLWLIIFSNKLRKTVKDYNGKDDTINIASFNSCYKGKLQVLTVSDWVASTVNLSIKLIVTSNWALSNEVLSNESNWVSWVNVESN